MLTHWGQVTHICVGNLTIIGSDNGLSPGRRQAIIWTNNGIFLIEPLGTNFSEILIEINTFSFKKMHLKLSSAKCQPFCLGLNVLIWMSFLFACSWRSQNSSPPFCTLATLHSWSSHFGCWPAPLASMPPMPSSDVYMVPLRLTRCMYLWEAKQTDGKAWGQRGCSVQTRILGGKGYQGIKAFCHRSLSLTRG